MDWNQVVASLCMEIERQWTAKWRQDGLMQNVHSKKKTEKIFRFSLFQPPSETLLGTTDFKLVFIK